MARAATSEPRTLSCRSPFAEDNDQPVSALPGCPITTRLRPPVCRADPAAESASTSERALRTFWSGTARSDVPFSRNAIHDAHRDDPEFGYRFLADEVRQDEQHSAVSDRMVWRICRDNQWWSRFGKPKRGRGSKPGTPSHDDLVRRDFTAAAPNQLWLTDLTEHRTPVWCHLTCRAFHVGPAERRHRHGVGSVEIPSTTVRRLSAGEADSGEGRSGERAAIEPNGDGVG